MAPKQIAKIVLPYFDFLIPKSAVRLKRLSGNIFRGDVLVCSGCGYGVLNKRLSEHDLLSFYANQYWRARNVQSMVSNTSDFKRDPRANHQVRFIHPYLKQRKMHKLLEIGAGRALVLQHLRDKCFPNSELYVCEPGREWDDYYLERQLERIDEFFPFKTGRKFDYIHTSHWLEHVLELEETVNTLHKLLSPKGIVFVEVPNTEHYYWDLGETDNPHIHFFTKSSLRNIFDRFSFECIEMGEFGITFQDRNMGNRADMKDFGPKSKGFWIRALFQKKTS